VHMSWEGPEACLIAHESVKIHQKNCKNRRFELVDVANILRVGTHPAEDPSYRQQDQVQAIASRTIADREKTLSLLSAVAHRCERPSVAMVEVDSGIHKVVEDIALRSWLRLSPVRVMSFCLVAGQVVSAHAIAILSSFIEVASCPSICK
jgi:hypothetical protein